VKLKRKINIAKRLKKLKKNKDQIGKNNIPLI
jgi:hypothetical protein